MAMGEKGLNTMTQEDIKDLYGKHGELSERVTRIEGHTQMLSRDFGDFHDNWKEYRHEEQQRLQKREEEKAALIKARKELFWKIVGPVLTLALTGFLGWLLRLYVVTQ